MLFSRRVPHKMFSIPPFSLLPIRQQKAYLRKRKQVYGNTTTCRTYSCITASIAEHVGSSLMIDPNAETGPDKKGDEFDHAPGAREIASASAFNNAPACCIASSSKWETNSNVHNRAISEFSWPVMGMASAFTLTLHRWLL